ncbi:MAG: ribonuclease HII [Gemmatimonadota bacterium]
MAETAPLVFEEEGWAAGCRHVVGVDEVGYGPLAGPVVVAAVALRRGQSFEGATDSKRLSARRREELASRIRSECLACSLAAASSREIERLNVRRATILAMQRALSRLSFRPDLLLVDGRRAPGLGEHRPIIGGDRRSQSIACASILAKVTRDRLMRRLGEHYPEYGWASNKGYRTREHLAAIRRFGPTPHHRSTFAGVLQIELALSGAGEARDAAIVSEAEPDRSAARFPAAGEE